MASYKVPQDVEADDKLIGPFSFRQFIYLIIVVLAGAGAWGLAQLFIGLAIIPLPVIILFGALALPLRKDQPMEIYMAAIVSFYLKPRRRLWDPDGIDSLVEITTPKVVEVSLTKTLTQSDTEQRLSYLANLVDTGGWAIRGAVAATNGPMTTDTYLEAQGAEDILDDNNSVAQSINTMMDKRTHEIREEAIERMHQPQQPQLEPQQQVAAMPIQQQPNQYAIPDQPEYIPAPSIQPTQQIDELYPTPIYNPYPNSMQQTVIRPLSDIPPETPEPEVEQIIGEPLPPTEVEEKTEPVTTSEKHISPDIMSLANNTGLSIQTIAHEAHRIQEKEDAKASEDEVIISLR